MVDVQRGGPSTGLPTKTEQADLLQAMFGRNGEAPLPIIAPRSPGDCFDAALEAARIAVTYRTPVLLLSDGSLANGSEPWQVPDASDAAEASTRASPRSRTRRTAPTSSGPTCATPTRSPARGRSPARRGWSTASAAWRRPTDAAPSPTTPTTTTAWSGCAPPRSTASRCPTSRSTTPTGDAELLVLGWGSTYGPIGAGARRVRALGHEVAQAHLRHLNPLPANLGEVLRALRPVLVPEMNLGQLVPAAARPRTSSTRRATPRSPGLPFKAEELQNVFLDHLDPQQRRPESHA